jgi:hypothetical protein
MRALEAYQVGSNTGIHEVHPVTAAEQSGKVVPFQRNTEIQPPPPFQFHDGTPEGETAYFESVAKAYPVEVKPKILTPEEEAIENEGIDAPLIHQDLQTEAWHAYTSDVADYYEARLQALGFTPWHKQPREEVVFEDIDWSLYPVTEKPLQLLTPRLHITSFAADE